MIESALRYELEHRISELTPSTSGDSTEYHVYATNAPENIKRPYLVYARLRTDKDKNYDGFTDSEAITYMFSCMATEYDDMRCLTDKVEAFLISIPQTSIGQENIFIQDVTINNISETWEAELGINRGIIDFTIFI